MEVKEFGIQRLPDSPSSLGLQKAGSSISSVNSAPVVEEPAPVSVDVHSSSGGHSGLRSELNNAINVINVTSDATDAMKKLVGSIDGIVKQVSSGEQPGNRIVVLEEEANQLVRAIRDLANKTHVGGVRPLAGDEMLVEVKERIGKQLSVIFPGDASEAFGIGSISFSRKEAIVETRARIEVAWRKIEELSKAVDDNATLIRQTVNQLEVASQNSKASEASPRDVEAAAKLADSASSGIAEDPERAMDSIKPSHERAGQLLK